MKLSDLVPIVSKIAPSLGGALAGPAGGIIGSLIATAFGSNNPQDLLEKINSDPEAALKLKSLEYQHEDALAKLQSINYQTEVDDRKSARVMQSTTRSYMPAIIATAFVCIYAFIQYFVISNPGQQDDVISARVQDILVMIVSFYFGSSHRGNT